MKLKEYFVEKWLDFKEGKSFEKTTILSHTQQLQKLAQRVLKLENAVFKESKQ